MKTAEEIISGKYKTFTLHLNGKNEKYMLYEDTLQAMESYRNQSQQPMKTKNELVIAFCSDKKQLIKSFETSNINPEYVEWLEQKLLSQSLTPMSEEEIRELAKKFLSLRILSKGARIEGGKVIHSTVDGENNANREISRISEFIVEFQSHFLTSKATESKPEITPMSEEEIDKWIEDAEFTEYNMIFKEDLPSWLIDFQSHLLSRVENKPVTLGKNSCLLDYTFPGGRFYNEDKGKREEAKPSREELIKFCKFVLPTIDQFVKDPYDKLVDQYLNKKDNPVEGKQ